jgi:pyruvate dehydrogenase E1 component alpha subunit
VQIDGNDVIAVHHAVTEALAKAHAGGGPTVIEAVTYRLADHTTADDASRYRPPEQVADAWKREPILRLRNYLGETGAWDKAREEALLKQCNEQVQAAAQAYIDTSSPAARADVRSFVCDAACGLSGPARRNRRKMTWPR